MENPISRRQLTRKAKPDPRDNRYLVKNHFDLKNKKPITKMYWDANGWWGDQLDTPHCVGYAWAHWLQDGPITHPGEVPAIHPQKIYEEAQKLDEWAGENYEGTSVRGGVKFLRRLGNVTSYYWAFDVGTVAQYILKYGPMVVGTDWYTGMFSPNRAGMIRAIGSIAGGHAYVINGVDLATKQFRIKNSWGKSWGLGGMAYISFTDMSKLIKAQGEACVATERVGSLILPS